MSADFTTKPGVRLARLFTAPPARFGPVPIWWWSGDPLDPVRLREQMEQMIAGGIRQAVVLNLAPSGPLYGALADEPAFFTDSWWQVFEGVCRDAQELGFSLLFYDQLGFSGADVQGRLVQRVPAYRGRALRRFTGSCPDDAEVLASYRTGDELMLICSVPYGFDYLSGPACADLLDCVHGEFERRVGGLFGSVIVGSFQDELPSMPTWSLDFATEFRKRRGYDLVPVLDALWGNGDGSVRHDYQRTRAELAEEAFFRPLHEWHQQRGLIVGCDQQQPARAGYPLEATQQYADYLRTHRWFSAPGSDHWGEAKVHSSLAHLYDRPRTWIEAFHGSGWGSTLEETYDWLLPWLRAGATLYNPHAVYYSTRGGRWEWAPPSTCWRQPYWRHYPQFATAVARLCAALSWGDHVCDVGVLFPTATVQAQLDLRLGEALFSHGRGVSRAQDTYLDVVGRMHWYEPEPGALDRDGRDFDVLDDDSVVRGHVEDGRLRIGAESYSVVLLPECTVLEEPTAKALLRFAEDGGVLVAVGAVAPELVGVARHLADVEDLSAALAEVPRRVTAPTPTLLRSDGESAVVLVLAAHPGATAQPGGALWRTQGYDFDVSRYATSMPVALRGFAGPVAVWDPGSGTSTPLQPRIVGDVLHVEVPLDSGPCALLVIGPAAAEAVAAEAGDVVMADPGRRSAGASLRLDDWSASLLPTLDNSWGDFAQPATQGPLPVQLWRLQHRSNATGDWATVTATFGPRGSIRRDGEWQPLVWSEAAGAPGGPDADEARGFVPEEFLDLGQVDAGEVVDLRFVIGADVAARGWLSVGCTADKQVRWNGRDVTAEPSPYFLQTHVDVLAGENLLEVRLTAATARRLRASWVLRPEAEPLPRPEWVTGRSLITVVSLVDVPHEAELQLGSIGAVTLRVNGHAVAVHGEFDNYSSIRHPRVRRYDLAEGLRTGENVVEIELHEEQSAAVVDAFFGDTCLVTNGRWAGVTGSLAEVPYDPRWIQLRPRPHPLPGAHELEGRAATEQLGSARPGTPAGREEFAVALPPGATTLRLPLTRPAEVLFEGARLAQQPDGRFGLPAPTAAGARVDVRVETDGTASGGALWTGPVEVGCDAGGSMPLGDWSGLGLRDWSGGVRYRTEVAGPVDATSLDLGAVRGTAEVRINGEPVGCRIWSPYAFDVAGLLDAPRNLIEVDVYNTLAPYVGAVSPTPWVLPGQSTSGILGPVLLHTHQSTDAQGDR